MRAFLLIAILGLTPHAVAVAAPKPPATLQACARDRTPAAVRVDVCSRLLKSADLTPDDRALALASRGLALLEAPAKDAAARRGAQAQATIDGGDAVRYAPSVPLGHVLRGAAAEMRGDTKTARADYDAAARLAPMFETYLSRGRLLRRLGEHEAAMVDLDRAIALGPQYASGYVARGLVWYDRGDFPRALQDFTKAAEVEPASPVPPLNQGLALEAMDRTAEAIALYDRMLTADPPNPSGYDARARARYKAGDLQAALADRHAYVRAAPKRSDGWVSLGSLLMETGDYKGGLAAYARAHSISALNPYLYNERCWARAVAGRDLEAAVADCDAALRLVPNAPSYLDSRGFARFRAGNFPAALADFDAALRAEPDKAESRYMRGATLRAMGRQAEGDADIAVALAKNPKIAAEYEKYGVRR